MERLHRRNQTRERAGAQRGEFGLNHGYAAVAAVSSFVASLIVLIVVRIFDPGIGIRSGTCYHMYNRDRLVDSLYGSSSIVGVVAAAA